MMQDSTMRSNKDRLDAGFPSVNPRRDESHESSSALQRFKYGSAAGIPQKINLDSGSFVNLNASMMSTQHIESAGGSGTPNLFSNDDSDYFNHNFVSSSQVVTPKQS